MHKTGLFTLVSNSESDENMNMSSLPVLWALLPSVLCICVGAGAEMYWGTLPSALCCIL